MVTVTVYEIGRIVEGVLQLNYQADLFSPGTQLLGSVPQLDSMSIVAILAAIEESYGIVIDDDEITAGIFETLGELATFVDKKVNG
jgi:acyl carrier protein